MSRSTRRPWFHRPKALFESLCQWTSRPRPAARRGRRSPADPVRLVLGELERREVASETLSFLASGLPAVDWPADSTADTVARVRYEQPATDATPDPLALTAGLSATPPAGNDPVASQPADQPAAGSGFWSLSSDDIDDLALPDVAPVAAGSPAETAQAVSGSGSAAAVEPAAPAPAAQQAPAPVATAPATDPAAAAAPTTATAPARLPAANFAAMSGGASSFTAPTFTPAANPFARGAANVWVVDANTAVTVLPGVAQHAFATWGVDLRAQAIGKAVSSYSWDVNSTDAPDVNTSTLGGTNTYRLTFNWSSFTGAARTDTISLTTTFADSTTDTQTFTFVVDATDSPAWVSAPVTAAADWPGMAGLGVFTPDKLQGEATAGAGPVTLGLDSGAVMTSHGLPSYNPDVPALGLVYNSTTADSRPVFLARYTLPAGVAVPATLKVTLTLNGTAGTPVYYDTSAANPGDVLQFALPADATALATGRYTYQVDTADPSFTGGGGGIIEDDPFAATATGKVDLINSHDSPLGAGWSLTGVERVWPVSGGLGSGGAMIEYPGGTSVFRATSGGIHTVGGAGDFSDFTHNGDGTYTQTLTDGTVIQFNSSGLQTSVVDRNGNTTTYGYDGSNRLTTITDPHGLTTALAYDATSGLLASVTDPAGAVTLFDHDTACNLTAVTDADGAGWAYGYDAAGRLTSVTDPDTHTTAVTYGAADRAAAVDLPDGSGRGLAPLAAQGLATGTYGTATSPAPVTLAAAAYAEFDDGRGSPWRTQFDWAGFGSAVQSFAPDGGVSLAYRDANGLPWLTADPLARRTRTVFDGPNPAETVAADDTFTEATYNAFSEPLTVTDANNHTATSTYDAAGDRLTATDADGVTTRYGYDARGDVVGTTTPLAAPAGWAETAVTQTTAGDQVTPVVAVNADGAGVAAWVGPDGSGTGVYARRLNPDGTPAGDEFLVNTYTTDEQSQPAVAVAPDGSFVVAWASWGGPGEWSGYGVYARRYAADGTPLDAAQFLVNTTISGYQYTPVVGYAADGSFVVAWSDPNNLRVVARVYAADGTPATGEVTLNPSQADWRSAPQLAVAADGSFVAGWYESDFSTYNRFVVGRFAADGTPATTPQTVVDVDNIEKFGMALGADGSALATWEAPDWHGFGIYGAVVAADGTVGSSFLIPAESFGQQEYQSSAGLAGGGWVVAWEDDTTEGSGRGVFARRVGADGVPVGDDFGLNVTTAGDQERVNVAAAPGGFAAVWQSAGQDGDGWGVYGRRYQFAAESRQVYDARGRLVKAIDPLGHVTAYGYDDASNQTLVTDPLGHTSTATYDALHRPLTATDALSGVTTFTYDAAGNLSTLTDPDDNTTTYALRDGLNRVLTETDPNGHDTTYSYDGNGDLVGVTDRDSRVRTFDYDLAGNRVDEIWWDGTTAIYEADYTYDLAGQLLTAADSNSSYTYTYDLRGRVTGEEQDFGPVELDLTYGYDAAGNRTSVADNLGATVGYAYTDANRPATLGLTVGSTLGPNVTFAYDSAGRLSGLTRREGAAGDTIATAYSFDPAGRLTGITHTSSAAGALSAFAYGYDAADRLTSYTGPEGSRAYGYDDIDQLTNVTDTDTSTVLESFAYDANGNRTMSGYSTGTGNRLTSDGTYTYTYDDEGNTLTKTEIATGHRWEYAYDDRNRLTEARELTGVGGTVLYDAQYTYDVFDRRVGVLEDADGAGSGAAVQTWAAYDGANAWADFDASGALATRYLNGLGMDERYARVAADGTVGWYLTDNLGSVRQVAQTNGMVVYAASYSAFGTIASETGAGGDRFKYTGREWDAGTGQYFFRARYYGAGVGRFQNEDPTGFEAGDTNVFRYVRNQPGWESDPTGLGPREHIKNILDFENAVTKNGIDRNITDAILKLALGTPKPFTINPCQKWAEEVDSKLPPRDNFDRVLGGKGLVARVKAWTYEPCAANYWGILVDAHFGIEVKFPDGQVFYFDDYNWGGIFRPEDVPPYAK